MPELTPSGSTRDKVQRLVAERPDLVVHLRRCLQLDDGTAFDDVPPAALAELERRGLIERCDR